MRVLVDSVVWSYLFRRDPDDLNADEAVSARELRELIEEGRACLTGAIRQQVLSGIRSLSEYVQLRDKLRQFDDLEVDTRLYEAAAELSNTCRRKGVVLGHDDALIAAAAVHHGMPLLTHDRDFQFVARHTKLRLHSFRDLP